MMDHLSSQGEIPITIPSPTPILINTSYGSGGHGHLIHHHQQQRPHDPTSAAARAPVPQNNPSSAVVPQNQIPPNTNGSIPMPTSLDHSHEEEEHHVNNANANVVPYKYSTFNNKKVGHNGVRYKECLKNHAAAMGGSAMDGCGEFMPSGEEGTIEALNCSACNCHRNFHRKEVEGEQQQLSSWDHNFHHTINRAVGIGSRNFLLNHGGGGGGGHHKSLLAPLQYPHQPQMLMSNYNMGMGMVGSILSDQSDEQEVHHHPHHGGGGGGGGAVGSRPPVGQVAKKRFRTKFTQEQKEKMLNFAEKVGWKIQKQEDSFVQNFCQEIGVKRRVLKVWMHNNKHNLANKIKPPPPSPPAP
ncbi:hypothetical protein ACFX2A_045654 [Malus domestica]